MARNADDTSSADQEEKRVTIQGWLQEEGWSTRFETAPEASWAITGVDQGNRHLVVAQRHDRHDQILINGSVNVSQQHRECIGALSEDERTEFMYELMFRLLTLDIEFDIIGQPLERVNIAQRIYYDGLTKDSFLQRVSLIRKGVVLVITSVQRQCAERPHPKELGFRGG